MDSLGMTLLPFAGLSVVAVMTPGPDFLMVTRRAVTRGRRAAYRTTLGILLGMLIWGLAGFFGIHALFMAAPWLYLALKIGGGAYLVFLGVRLLRESFRSLPGEGLETIPLTPKGGDFRLGLMTNLANPKAAIFTTSLFAVTLPPQPSLALGMMAIVLMVAIGAVWFFLVSRLLTTEAVAALFLRARRGIDRAAGLIFIAFGARLAFAASED